MPEQTVTAKFVADISNFQSNLRALQSSARELKSSAAEMSSALSQSSSGMQQMSQAATQAENSGRRLSSGAKESRTSFLSLAGSAAEVFEEISEVVGAVAQLVVALGKQRDAAKAAEAGFTSLTLSTAAAKKEMEEISRLSTTKAYGTEAVTKAVLLLQRLGVESKKAQEWVDKVGNALAAAGQGSENLVPIILKMREIQKQATVTEEDIDELAIMGINAWEILEFQTNKSQEQIKKEMKSGAMSGQEAYKLLFDGMIRDMGAAETASHGFGSSLGRLGEEMGKGFGPFIDGLTKVIDFLAEAEKNTHMLANALKLIVFPPWGVFDINMQNIQRLQGHASGITDNPVGHVGWVGENGPELMYIPEHTTIFPSGINPFESRSPSSSQGTMGGASRGMQLPLMGGGQTGPIILQVKLDSKVVAQQTFPHLSAMIREFKGVRK